jgi:prolipoprotein diacylglyceryltransferase
MKIEPTKISNLILIFVFMTTFGWSVTRLWPTWFDVDLQVPALAPVTIYVLAIALTVWTLMVKARLNPENKLVSLDPIVGARTAALAMASSRVGSLGAGFYSGVFLVNFLQREHSIVIDRLWASGLSVIGGIVVTVIALWLERICKIKQPPANTQTPGVPA